MKAIIYFILIFACMSCHKCGPCEESYIISDQHFNKLSSGIIYTELCGDEYRTRDYLEYIEYDGRPAIKTVIVNCK